MNETSKSAQRRKELGHDRILQGNGIDIGCGADPLKIESGNVLPWDVDKGDAQLMLGVDDNVFDFVFSSHCLEHLRNVPEALHNWKRILKPGGWLYVVVPDYLFYEKMNWPSRFNSDHKQTFSVDLSRKQVRRVNHWQIVPDISTLLWPDLHTFEYNLQTDGYDFNRGFADQTTTGAMSQIYFLIQKPR